METSIPVRRASFGSLKDAAVPVVTLIGEVDNNISNNNNNYQHLVSCRRKSTSDLGILSHIPFWRGFVQSLSTRKSVTFNHFVRVILIPTKEELLAANLNLWNNQDDFKKAKKSAYLEAMSIASHFKTPRVPDLLSILYQPKSTCFSKTLKVLILEKNMLFQMAIIKKLSAAFKNDELLIYSANSEFCAMEKCNTALVYDMIIINDSMDIRFTSELYHDLHNCCDGLFVGIALGSQQYIQNFKNKGDFDYIVMTSLFHTDVWSLLAAMLAKKHQQQDDEK